MLTAFFIVLTLKYEPLHQKKLKNKTLHCGFSLKYRTHTGQTTLAKTGAIWAVVHSGLCSTQTKVPMVERYQSLKKHVGGLYPAYDGGCKILGTKQTRYETCTYCHINIYFVESCKHIYQKLRC